MLIAYHCRNCGAPVDPEHGKCAYCDTYNKFDYRQKLLQTEKKRRNVRVCVETKSKERIYLDEIVSFDWEVDSIVESCRLGDGRAAWVKLGDTRKLRLTMLITPDTRRQLSFMEGIFTVMVEFVNDGRVFKFDAYRGDIKMECGYNEVSTLSTSIISADGNIEENEIQVSMPEGLLCPNCGAPIHSKLCVCDYCGGWVEWFPGEKGEHLLYG